MIQIYCTVHGIIKDIIGNPVRDAQVIIEPCYNGPDRSTEAITVFTDYKGKFSVMLVRNMDVIIHASSFKKRITVPDKDSINIAEL